jgi:hypothetical protein
MRKAEKDFDVLRYSIEMAVVQVQTMTKQSLGKVGLGADGALQMAFQLAHFRMTGRNACKTIPCCSKSKG